MIRWFSLAWGFVLGRRRRMAMPRRPFMHAEYPTCDACGDLHVRVVRVGSVIEGWGDVHKPLCALCKPCLEEALACFGEKEKP
jgi:hypothetical protein